MAINPNNPDPYFELSRLYRRLGSNGKSIEVLEALEKSGALSNFVYPWYLPSCYALLGEAYRESGRREAAKVHFQKVLELVPDPQRPIDVNLKGRAFFGLGDTTAMQQTIDEGFVKFPGNVEMCYGAASLYSLARDEQKALEWLALALEKDERKALFLECFMEKGVYGLAWTIFGLDNIHQSPDFKALMKKHFPDQVKD